MSTEIDTQLEIELTRSPTIGSIAAALAKAQGMMRNAKKDSVNPHFKSSYADLAAVVNVVREPLSVNGIAVLQTPGVAPDGSVTMTTLLAHSSGEWFEGVCRRIPVAQRTPQGVSSTITYARRFMLNAMTGVAPEDDDDGNAGSRAGPPQDAGRRTTEASARSTSQPRTEAVKEKLKTKMAFVDVKPGETEAEATARESAPPAEPPPSEAAEAANKLTDMGKFYGFTGKGMLEHIKNALGKKPEKEELTLAMVASVREYIETKVIGAATEEQVPF